MSHIVLLKIVDYFIRGVFVYNVKYTFCTMKPNPQKVN